MEARAPNHIGNIETPAIRQKRKPVLYTGHARHTLDARRRKRLIFHPDKWGSLRCHSRLRLTAKGRVDRQQAVKHDAEDEALEEQACSQAVNTKWHRAS